MQKNTSSIALGLTLAMFILMLPPFSRMVEAQTAPTSLPFGSEAKVLQYMIDHSKQVLGNFLRSSDGGNSWSPIGQWGPFPYSPTQGNLQDFLRAKAKEGALQFTTTNSNFLYSISGGCFGSDIGTRYLACQTSPFTLESRGDGSYGFPSTINADVDNRFVLDYSHGDSYFSLEIPGVVWAQAYFSLDGTQFKWDSRKTEAGSIEVRIDKPNLVAVEKMIVANAEGQYHGYFKYMDAGGVIHKYSMTSGAVLALDPSSLKLIFIDGGVKFRFTGEPEANVVPQSSPDLEVWTDLIAKTRTIGVDGTVDCLDLAITQAPAGFYRLRYK